MQDATIVAHFDGRPMVELTFSDLQPSRADRATWIGAEFGYELSRYEPYGRGHFRLAFTRDSPTSRHRAAATLARIRSAGTWYPPVQPWTTQQLHGRALIHPERAARVRRSLMAYEGWHPAQLILACGLVGLVLLPFAWIADAVLIIAVAAPLGVLSLVAAVFGPRCVRKWHQKNLQLLEDFRQQQAAQSPVPPPLPPPPLPPPPPYGL